MHIRMGMPQPVMRLSSAPPHLLHWQQAAFGHQFMTTQSWLDNQTLVYRQVQAVQLRAYKVLYGRLGIQLQSLP